MITSPAVSYLGNIHLTKALEFNLCLSEIVDKVHSGHLDLFLYLFQNPSNIPYLNGDMFSEHFRLPFQWYELYVSLQKQVAIIVITLSLPNVMLQSLPRPFLKEEPLRMLTLECG